MVAPAPAALVFAQGDLSLILAAPAPTLPMMPLSRAATFPGGGAKFFSTADPGIRLPGVGRNSFRGPNYRNIDLSVTKRFGMAGFLGEATLFEVKANFFNAFNILNLQPFQFNSISTQVQNVNFGRAEKGLSGRVVEIQGRFSF